MPSLKLVVAVALGLLMASASACTSSEPTGDEESEISSGAVSLSDEEGALLLDKATCLGCHALDKKVVGPSFRAVAKRYRDAPRAETIAQLTTKVHRGGSGAWGPIPMPPNVQVFRRDVECLVTYILELPDLPPASDR